MQLRNCVWEHTLFEGISKQIITTVVSFRTNGLKDGNVSVVANGFTFTLTEYKC